jgi:hypothetical protein
MHRNRGGGAALVAVWLTPGPRRGDLLLVGSQHGEHQLRVLSVEAAGDPGDMYWLEVQEEARES